LLSDQQQPSTRRAFAGNHLGSAKVEPTARAGGLCRAKRGKRFDRSTGLPMPVRSRLCHLEPASWTIRIRARASRSRLWRRPEPGLALRWTRLIGLTWVRGGAGNFPHAGDGSNPKKNGHGSISFKICLDQKSAARTFVPTRTPNRINRRLAMYVGTNPRKKGYRF
jgi:hypothetical protein